MGFTSEGWLAVIAAVSGLVVVVGGVVVNVIVALRRTVEKVGVHVEATASKIEEISTKATTIAAKVDGAASASVAEIKSLQEGMTLLREVIAGQKQAAAVLAAKTPHVVPPKELNGPVIDESLQSIDQNTKAIKENTAKTETAVKKLEQDKG